MNPREEACEPVFVVGMNDSGGLLRSPEARSSDRGILGKPVNALRHRQHNVY